MTIWNEIAGKHLHALCQALGFSPQAPSYDRLLRELFAPWGASEVPPRPASPCFVSDDQAPYEFSVAMTGQGAELRLLFEAQAPAPSLRANHEAALALNARLASDHGVDLRRFELVRDLFCPATPRPPFSIWHAVSMRPGKPPAFKIYLNPQASGRDRTRATVAEALRRLGLAEASRSLLANLDAHGRGRDEFNYFSLDLSDEPTARVKVYSVHPDATADDLERSFAFAPSHRPGDVSEFCARIAGTTGPFTRKPLTSCFSFVGGASPSAATVHLPASSYVPDEATLRSRQLRYLSQLSSHSDLFERVLEAMRWPAMPGAQAAQSYASMRREAGALRLTAYFTPGVFAARSSGLLEPLPRAANA